jgi:hypothetical protein
MLEPVIGRTTSHTDGDSVITRVNVGHAHPVSIDLDVSTALEHCGDTTGVSAINHVTSKTTYLNSVTWRHTRGGK